MQQLKKITQEELKDKRLTGLEDTPGLSALEMQTRFDAHPDKNTEVINFNADAQNTVNSEIDRRITSQEEMLAEKVDKEFGMGLYPDYMAFTDNNFTDEEKEKLFGIDEGANRYDDTKIRSTLNKKADKSQLDEAVKKLGSYPVVNMTSSSATLEPNKFYKWGEVMELSLFLSGKMPGITNEYTFSFASGNVPTVLNLPAYIKWITPVNIESGKTYEVSIFNDVGVIFGA